MAMTTQSLACLTEAGFHRIAYTEWRAGSGSDSGRTVVCVHGLTRNGRDFDALAEALEADYRVVCPDVAGRGESGWLARGDLYGYPTYCADMAALIARLDTETVDWVGTSMGGLIGMLIAAQPDTPIRRLVVNDVGPFVPKAAQERIATYVDADPVFASIDAAADHFAEVHAPFGDLTRDQWRHLASTSVRQRDDGQFVLRRDPAFAQAFKAGPPQDVDLWPIWDAIECPVLALRGAESDLLLADIAEEMAARGPKATVVEIAGVGHAPALMDDQQIATVRDWLLAD